MSQKSWKIFACIVTILMLISSASPAVRAGEHVPSVEDILRGAANGHIYAVDTEDLISVLSVTKSATILEKASQIARSEKGSNATAVSSYVAYIIASLDDRFIEESGDGDDAKKVMVRGRDIGAYVAETYPVSSNGVTINISGTAPTVAAMIRNGSLPGIIDNSYFRAAALLSVNTRTQSEFQLSICLCVANAYTGSLTCRGIEPASPVTITLSLPNDYVGYDLKIAHRVDTQTGQYENVPYYPVNAGRQIRFTVCDMNPITITKSVANQHAVSECDHLHVTSVESLEETCSCEGHISYWVCNDCGQNFADKKHLKAISDEQVSIPKASSHKWDSGVMIQSKADGTAYAVKYTCSICGISRTEIISQSNPISIKKKPTGIKARVASNGKLILSWNGFKNIRKNRKAFAQISKIEIQYCTDKSFTTNVKTKVIGKRKTKQTLKLKPRTVYYIRIRYCDGTGGYSKWAKKTVKTA